MQRLNTLWSLVATSADTAERLRNFAQPVNVYSFPVGVQPITVYIQTEQARV
ncbi:MAG: hypothetical protein H7Y11_11790, partial [Armatimonadetes bacterium]|nr:hypothetical protein [Anaerolineae bacterium]